jgi:hypothetical protein
MKRTKVKKKMAKSRREYLSKVFADIGKSAFTVLVLGGIGAFFLKRDTLTVVDLVCTLVIGATLGVSLIYTGYVLTPKEEGDE